MPWSWRSIRMSTGLLRYWTARACAAATGMSLDGRGSAYSGPRIGYIPIANSQNSMDWTDSCSGASLGELSSGVLTNLPPLPFKKVPAQLQ